jgi:hypothetical protein
MRRHLWMFLAWTLLMAWSGPVNAQDQTLGGDDCAYNCAGQEAECLWASSSLHQGCPADSEEPDRGVDEEDDDSINEPTADWA